MSSTTPSFPAKGWQGLADHWKQDLVSGFLVFLIALPLCIGISLASGFPAMSGILTAVIGGLVVSRLSGSQLTINGPAAGLIVVILNAVHTLGGDDAVAGVRYTLAAIFIASVLQIFTGLVKAGKLNAYFPASVVHGMLAAIGLIIMVKQIHVLLGAHPVSRDLIGSLLEIPHSLTTLNPSIALIGTASLLILTLWPRLRVSGLAQIPAPLIAVAVGIGLGHVFDLETPHLVKSGILGGPFAAENSTLGPEYLVQVPLDFGSMLQTPDFSHWKTPEFASAVLAIWLVGTLETLLSTTAVDKLDPYKRESNLNRDLTAIGVGNLVTSLLGGLPMIAEIVRSSANINAGAKTGWANFFHGGFLLLFVLCFPRLIDQIPLASLAALLVFTGFRLASPREFAKTMQIGHEQLFIFTVTIITVIATDLLIGVLCGIVLKIGIHLIRGVPLSQLLRLNFSIEQTRTDFYRINIEGHAIFANFVGLKSELAELPQGATLMICVEDAEFIDHTVMEFLEAFSKDYELRGGTVQHIGFEGLACYSEHPLAARRRV